MRREIKKHNSLLVEARVEAFILHRYLLPIHSPIVNDVATTSQDGPEVEAAVDANDATNFDAKSVHWGHSKNRQWIARHEFGDDIVRSGSDEVPAFELEIIATCFHCPQ